MINITNIAKKDLEKIKGGATLTIGAGLIIAAAIVFVSGIIEGITNPERCHG